MDRREKIAKVMLEDEAFWEKGFLRKEYALKIADKIIAECKDKPSIQCQHDWTDYSEMGVAICKKCGIAAVRTVNASPHQEYCECRDDDDLQIANYVMDSLGNKQNYCGKCNLLINPKQEIASKDYNKGLSSKQKIEPLGEFTTNIITNNQADINIWKALITLKEKQNEFIALVNKLVDK